MRDIGAFMHVNVNCSDLARSRRFYEDALGLIASAHTRPEEPQPGAGFGLSGEALWDAWILDDPRGMGSSASLDLLRWETPPPVGQPPGFAPAIGIHRLGYAVPALEETLARLATAGRGTLPLVDVERGGRATRLGWALDPDGTAIEVAAQATVSGAVEARQVTVVCSDLECSIRWYESTLGLKVTSRERDVRGNGAAFGVAHVEAAWDAAVLEVAGRANHYALRLESWRTPAPLARRPPVANQLGPFRIAFLVDDAQAWHADLEGRGVRMSGPPVWLDMGPQIPIDGLWALFFFDPDGVCVELIQTPELRA